MYKGTVTSKEDHCLQESASCDGSHRGNINSCLDQLWFIAPMYVSRKQKCATKVLEEKLQVASPISTCEVHEEAISISLTKELLLLLYTESRALQDPPLTALGKRKARRKMRL